MKSQHLIIRLMWSVTWSVSLCVLPVSVTLDGRLCLFSPRSLSGQPSGTSSLIASPLPWSTSHSKQSWGAESPHLLRCSGDSQTHGLKLKKKQKHFLTHINLEMLKSPDRRCFSPQSLFMAAASADTVILLEISTSCLFTLALTLDRLGSFLWPLFWRYVTLSG